MDVRVDKTFRIKDRVTIEPTADIFNIFNNGGITSQVNTIGPSLGKPSMIEFGRLVRLGGRFNF